MCELTADEPVLASLAGSLRSVIEVMTKEVKRLTQQVLDEVKVDTSTVVTANLILQTGDVATEVTVSANGATVNTESGTLGQTISSRMLDDTPLPTRSVLDLAITVGNVTGDVGWSWMVGTRTTPGAWPVTLSCGGASARTEVVVP